MRVLLVEDDAMIAAIDEAIVFQTAHRQAVS